MSRIGELCERIDIKREKRTADGMGGWTVSDQMVATVWAGVRVPASKDGMIAGADAEIRTHVVRVRQSADTLTVQINDTITWRGYSLTVRACRPLEREWIDFDCKLEVPE
jgi:SPP1 family predicted phage head-tail adaptor